MPARRSFAMPRPRTRGFGSTMATTIRRSPRPTSPPAPGGGPGTRLPAALRDQVLQLTHELVHVAERAVHRGEAHVGDGVERVQLAHHGLADRAAGDLPLAALLELALDLVDQGLDGVDRDRALLAGALEPVHDLGALEGLPPAVLLDHPAQRLR